MNVRKFTPSLHFKQSKNNHTQNKNKAVIFHKNTLAFKKETRHSLASKDMQLKYDTASILN
jgi:hypothetical protein